MNAATRELWLDLNQRHLAGELARVRTCLERALGAAPAATSSPGPAPSPGWGEGERGAVQPANRVFRSAGAAADLTPTAPDFLPAIDRLAARLGLSAFERDTLLLAAGAEMDSAIARLCGRAQGLAGPAAPTFSLALACLPGAHWSALSPERPLRAWRLLHAAVQDLVTTAPLRIEERVLHYLAGIEGLDPRLAPLICPLAGRGALADGQREAADRIAAWIEACHEPAIAIQVFGRSGAAVEEVAAAAAEALGLRLYRMAAAELPAEARERAECLALWRRDALLGGAALLIDAGAGEAPREALAAWLAGSAGVVLVAAREPLPLEVPHLRCEVPAADALAQRDAWRAVLGRAAEREDLSRLTSHFSLEPREILALAPVAGGAGEPSPWQLCRERRRRGLDGLAQRLDSTPGWDDLVLPEAETRLLATIAEHVRHRDRVYREWGFAAKGTRGLGLSALFSGPSGTGKTLAAEVLSNALELDVYRIDLSSVVSKYIGETEKNLKRVFDAAEDAGAILLFDEADALFGKRSEVRDSHDRYANVEIAYLLTKMESYRGLSILTTNLRSALDEAFLRRIRFVVQFPFPGARQRAEIWRRAFPPATPTEGLDYARLARMSLAGGNIRNVALGAAFRAAERGGPVSMAHILEAARGEYAKLERPATESELGAP